VFVDGCFWHMCPSHSSMPTANRSFWRRKLAMNVERDRRTRRDLRAKGWTVIRIWQHELQARAQKQCVARIQRALLRESKRQNGVHTI
jgi:DNA mismatch endonuclease (patch repair protein)